MRYYDNPLVSVPVVTYNSSRTILETLDSIYNQTYQNLELIVSDDCSTDNTIQICQDWIESHKKRFVRTELLTANRNTGVSANSNRAKSECRGEWVKGIAGDDILLPECVETYVDYVRENKDVIYVFSRAEVFGEDPDKVCIFQNSIFDYSFFDLPISEQYKWMITRSVQPIPAATTFYHRERALALGISNDERIPFLEDWPKWIRLLEKDIRFNFINKPLVRYRVSDNSICSGTIYREKFRKSISLLYLYYQYEPDKKFSGRFKAFYKYLYYKKAISDKKYWSFAYFVMRGLTFPKRMLKAYAK